MKTPHLLIICGTIIVVVMITGVCAVQVASILNPTDTPEPSRVDELSTAEDLDAEMRRIFSRE
jgi:uncharacterized protein YpmB